MNQLKIVSIGRVKIIKNEMFIIIEEEYAKALTGLNEFSHVNVLWWFSDCDNNKDRDTLSLSQPYKKGPSVMGVFALRQPQRPNPIALSVAKIINVNYKKNFVQVNYIDAKDGSPVIDLKPYTPSLDFVEDNTIPKWCEHWPNSYEKSLDYNWKNEFTFY